MPIQRKSELLTQRRTHPLFLNQLHIRPRHHRLLPAFELYLQHPDHRT